MLILYPRRGQRGGMVLLTLTLAVTAWTFSASMESAALTRNAAIFWAKTAYLGISTVPLLFLFFALEYAHRDSWLTPLRRKLLWGVPLFTLLMVFTNELHLLVWKSISVEIVPGTPFYLYEHGVYFWMLVVYNYLLLILSTLIILDYALRSHRLYRMQTVLILIGMLLPWLGNFLYLIKASPLPGADLTPLMFMFSGFLLTFAIFRCRMFDISPIARDQVFQNLKDGLIVLDASQKVVDINAAAQKMLRLDDVPLGKKLGEVAPKLAKTLQGVLEHPVTLEEYSRSVEVDTSAVSSFFTNAGGQIIILRDVTQRKKNDAELLESQEKYQELFELGSEAIFLIDNETGRLLEANRAASEMYGYTHEELLAMRNLDLSAEPSDTRRVTTSSPPGSVIVPRRYHRRKDGSVFPTEINGRFFTWHGRAVHVAAIRDVTDRLRLEQSEVRARQRAEALNEVIHAISSEVDLKSLLTRVDEQLSRLLDARHLVVSTYDANTKEWTPIYTSGYYDENRSQTFPLSQGISGWVLQNRQPVLLNNLDEIEAFFKKTGRYPINYSPRSMMAVPLIFSDRVIGVMSLQNQEEQNHYTPEDFTLFTAIAVQVATALENANLFSQMKHLAATDGLTEFYNRRAFFVLAEQEVAKAQREQEPLSLVMIDLDHFKKVNDTLGHSAGDEVLRNMSQAVRQSVRKIDILGRYGGEEFVALLPGTPLSEATMVAERICRAIENTQVVSQNQGVQVTASIGVAQLDLADPSLEQLVYKADQAMYRSKDSGRNRVSVVT